MKRYADIALRLPSARERWSGEPFRAELAHWVVQAVGDLRSLDLVKLRPWATVWRAETATGVFYAKQNCSTQAYEAALLVALNDMDARRVVPLTAADTTRGLFLTPDQGEPLGDAVGADGDAWCRVVSAGAHLQLEVARYVERLAATGLTTLAPMDCPGYVEEQLASFAALPADDPRALLEGQGAALHAALPRVREWAEEVAALGLPLTLCHNDLHGHNVFDSHGELRFFDFADAMLTEPLAALLVPVNALAHRLRLPPHDPLLWRVADAGLEVWSDYAPMSELRAALPAALQLARLARAESWIRCIAPMTDAELDEWGESAAYWLAALLMDPPIAGTRHP